MVSTALNRTTVLQLASAVWLVGHMVPGGGAWEVRTDKQSV